MDSQAAWLLATIAAPIGIAAVVGLLRGYSIVVRIWRGDNPPPDDEGKE